MSWLLLKSKWGIHRYEDSKSVLEPYSHLPPHGKGSTVLLPVSTLAPNKEGEVDHGTCGSHPLMGLIYIFPTTRGMLRNSNATNSKSQALKVSLWSLPFCFLYYMVNIDLFEVHPLKLDFSGLRQLNEQHLNLVKRFELESNLMNLNLNLIS